MAGQAGCYHRQDRSAASHPNSSGSTCIEIRKPQRHGLLLKLKLRQKVLENNWTQRRFHSFGGEKLVMRRPKNNTTSKHSI
ncbi:hypothetical protein J6590_081352 [Homalodisca vitripennis]|nr:hypothetical protein J6590_081352 [Homalodisca vitripennis]